MTSGTAAQRRHPFLPVALRRLLSMGEELLTFAKVNCVNFLRSQVVWVLS